MQAVIIRHGKVDYHWKKWSTSKQFDEDCKMYDEAPIFPLLSDGSWIGYKNIYISSLQRSRETANQLFGEKDFISTKLIDEVPLCASITSSKKLPLIFWNVLGRFQYSFTKRMQERHHLSCRAVYRNDNKKRDRLHYCYAWIFHAHSLKSNEKECISNQPHTIKLFKR